MLDVPAQVVLPWYMALCDFLAGTCARLWRRMVLPVKELQRDRKKQLQQQQGQASLRSAAFASVQCRSRLDYYCTKRRHYGCVG